MAASSNSKSLKVIIIGDGGTGKTSLVNRFIHRKFSSIYKTTIGVDISPFNTVTKGPQEKSIRFVLWDMSGQTHFKRFRTRFYSGTSGAIVVYDLTKVTSYRNVNSWIKECQENVRKPIPIIIIGNKSDLTELRVETPRSMEHGFPVYNTSAKNGTEVDNSFMSLFEEIVEEPLEKIDDEPRKTTHISYDST
ncbi:MAG: Rab family GTPase [Candidatus Hodarchaeales archaeon]|jgi:small GTP-binding protein